MEREKRSSRLLGSRLSSIFTSLDYSQSQPEHHEARSIQSKLSSGSLNPLSKPPLSNLPMLYQSDPKRDFKNKLPSDTHSMSTFSNESVSLPKPARKLTRKPPPPGDDLDSFKLSHSNDSAKPHAAALKERKYGTSIDTANTKADSLDEIICTLEDEIHDMMNFRKPSQHRVDTTSEEVQREPSALVNANSIRNADRESGSESQRQFFVGDLGPTQLSQPDHPFNSTSREPARTTHSNPYQFPPTAENEPVFDDQLKFGNQIDTEYGELPSENIASTAQHEAYQLRPTSLVSVESLHFVDTMGEPIHNVETNHSSVRSNMMSENQSQLSMSLTSKIESQDLQGPPHASSRSTHTSSQVFESDPARSKPPSPHSTYPTELLHEVLTSGSTGGNVATNSSNPTLDRVQPSIRANYPHQTRQPLRSAPTFTSIASDSTFSKALVTSTPANTFHRKSLSISSIFSTNSNRHITLAALKKSISLRPGEGERSNYVQTVRRNAGTSYNDLGPETWKLPVGILPVDKRQLTPSNDRYNRLRGNRKNQSSGVGLKHGHLAPRLLATEVDESEGLNKFGSLGRSSTFQRHEGKQITPVSLSRLTLPSTALSRGNSLRQNSNAPSRTGSFAGSVLSSILPSTTSTTPVRDSGSHVDSQSHLSRHTLTSSRHSVGSISEARLTEGYYQHPGYRYDEEMEETDRFSPSTDGTMHQDFEEENEVQKPRLVLANPDSESSDNE